MMDYYDLLDYLPTYLTCTTPMVGGGGACQPVFQMAPKVLLEIMHGIYAKKEHEIEKQKIRYIDSTSLAKKNDSPATK